MNSGTTPENGATDDHSGAVRILPVGDTAMTVQFGEVVDEEVNRRVIALAEALRSAAPDGLLETVPTYRSLLVSYDPEILRGAALERHLHGLLDGLDTGAAPGRLWRVPVVYGGAAGLDLEELAEAKGMSPEALIKMHSDAEYRVYMIGFAPGFTYLGGLPEALHTPRLSTPRLDIPAGAIGIGGQQASINSVAGPSGWRFIGQTPWRAFDPDRAEPFLFAAGDRVRFVPVTEDEARAFASPRPEQENLS
ncbi:allophanate hydrolase [Salipiger pallidus]|uniref:Allophanate hydrolase n=1 Tax=Salipiger pallidus TaxID=1775170 RepID=A0A8J3EHD4_9RHOB|nr:5-oxoprolinase subunit PxpB [Salipiger pallidus]GGG82580.1 allophanate hydrolase [Salipiger pallidus]